MFDNRRYLKKAIKLYCLKPKKCIKKYGEPSAWDVSKVTNMRYMFYNSQFNGDISNWDVSNVIDMSAMFEYGRFNGDISKWNIINLKYDRYAIVRLMTAHTKYIKIVKALDPDRNTCPVMYMPIVGDYVRCDTCRYCFDISIKQDWIDKYHNCPHCQQIWTSNTIYSQPQ